MEWFTDPILCQRRIDDLHAQPAYAATAFAAFQDGEDLSQPQMKLIRQMERATARLAELKGLSQVASGDRKRPWEAAVDLTQLPGSDRLELTRNDDGKDKGLRKQFLETQHHFVAHSASQLALNLLAGVELLENVTLALEFLSETAEKGIARAKARAKILALVSDKGPEVGWKICEKLERKSYAEDEEDEKLMRKAEKEVKAEKIHAAQAAAAKGRTKGLGRGAFSVLVRLLLEHLRHRRLFRQGVAASSNAGIVTNGGTTKTNARSRAQPAEAVAEARTVEL
ncbi:hypothetical protein CYMTET_11634 [Cymbomonas tetramitiformis]|uniref:Uncharacterized protein n=1 Tax=Cymbomonas tetramitiformis TaxID=36881 RepID=A0AAE0GLZ0_9CHLO|nr:hypothetical protein CYMTET_11634 [Cymbomonas tetramitiformis]